MEKHISIVWLKRDFRIHDHKPLAQAIRSKHTVLVILDSRAKSYPASRLQPEAFCL
ncbi:deoxyribodipyrimidine photo-lyase [Schleiferia thermophila]|uniref:deoxyribodipyrimidine photo-lyase n=1 Tax=Schleiferia thermophila TaxID=884107 RepID=UPI001B88304A